MFIGIIGKVELEKIVYLRLSNSQKNNKEKDENS